MFHPNTIEWLLEGDVSIQYQVHLDLLNTELPELKAKIATEGWGASLLSFRNPNGHWGMGFYQPKWISSHYTLLELKHLCLPNNQTDAKATIEKILNEEKSPDGGVNPASSISQSDICVNGMFLNYASWFHADENKLKSIVDFILAGQMKDGGFNCRFNRSGAMHSSLHSTLCVAEGISEYARQGYNYRVAELRKAEKESVEFMLEHKLYKSHRTGAVIDKKMTMLSWPSRWRFDILRALDYFCAAGFNYDPRMQDALDLLINKQRPDKTWPVQAKHPGKTRLDYEKTGSSSRWNTLRTLRVLNHFNIKVNT